jgi:isopentenyl-diphosphate delta-isomerase
MSQVLLVDENDQVVGKTDKEAAHKGSGQRHRAFSVLILNSQGQMLIQKRSRHKPLWPLFWTNACCSHQTRLGDDREQAEQRLQEELGFTVPLQFLFKFPYQKTYQEGLSENEITSVFSGHYDGPVVPDSREVADYRWVNLPQLGQEIESQPSQFTPWFKKIIQKIQKDKNLGVQL